MFAISNEEISNKPSLGTTAKCNSCGKMHIVEYGDIVKADGTKEQSTLLAYIKCTENDSLYMVGINGKLIF